MYLSTYSNEKTDGNTELRESSLHLIIFVFRFKYNIIVCMRYGPAVNRNGYATVKDAKSLEWELQVVFPKEEREGGTIKKVNFFVF